jgi:hypothetical protein
LLQVTGVLPLDTLPAASYDPVDAQCGQTIAILLAIILLHDEQVALPTRNKVSVIRSAEKRSNLHCTSRRG